MQQMSYDRSWRLRQQFSEFVRDFIEPLNEYKDRDELVKTKGLGKIEVKVKFPISLKAKKTKKAFKTILKDLTREIISDGDDHVALEGMSIFVDYDFLFLKSCFVDEFKPRLEEILKSSVENRISVSL